MPWIDTKSCKACFSCMNACPVDGAIIAKDDHAEIVQSICNRCGACLSVCPQNAVRPNSDNPDLRGQGFNNQVTGPGIFRSGQGLGGSGRGLGRGSGQGRGGGTGRRDGTGRGGGGRGGGFWR